MEPVTLLGSVLSVQLACSWYVFAVGSLRYGHATSRYSCSLTIDLVVYMGLEVGGCSLFADPSGYVGRRTHQPWEDEHHRQGRGCHDFVEDGRLQALRMR